MANPITKRREQLGLTQAELARRADVPYQRIWQLENGKRHYSQLTVEVAIRIAKSLKTKVEKLV